MGLASIVLDCARLEEPDLATLEAIVRTWLLAHEEGARFSLANVSPRLRELIELCGLSAVLGVDVQWEAEQRE